MTHSSTKRKILSCNDRILVERCESFGADSFGAENESDIGSPIASLDRNDASNQFLCWFPAQKPTGSSIAVASSRLSQKLDEHSEWFDALRTLAVQTAGEPRFLITAAGTTTDAFVRRLSELFQIRIVVFEPFPKNRSNKWFEEQVEKARGTDTRQFTAYFKQLDSTPPAQNELNVNDLLISIADTSVLLSVQNGGNVIRAAQRRLRRESKPATRLLINRRLTPKPVETQLLENGATAWWLYDQTNDQHDGETPPPSRSIRNPVTRALTIDEIKTENYLLHWTRRRVGPWPDQSNPEYLDDLIFQTTRRQHGEVSALCRILASGRILASNHLIRDPRDVVCFSDLPLEKMSQRRTFRPHLSRWDFEPFGIAIEREILQKRGARPVIYGTEEDWAVLADHDRPFFQLRKSKSEQIDWELEREWRILGDLKLDEIPFDQAVVFVKTQSAAQSVSGLSRWPVVVLG